jgi:hypothetical protein
MYTDMIILPPTYDMWGEMGVQTEPFPIKLNVDYTSIIWESINKTGGAADYTTEIILNDSMVKDGYLCYGPKKYNTIILPEVTTISPSVLEKLYNFVVQGGKVICIEKLPFKAPGFQDYKLRDELVASWVKKLQNFENFIFVEKPDDKKYLEWYQELMVKYDLPHYMEISNPDRFIYQTRYTRDDKSEMFFFSNCHRYKSHTTRVKFSKETLSKGNPWRWEINTGKRYRLALDKDGSIEFNFGPSEAFLVVFDKTSGKAEYWNPVPTTGANVVDLSSDWDLELRQPYENTVENIHFDKVINFVDNESTKHFAGTAIYRKTINVDKPEKMVMNLGLVEGICEMFVNGESLGVQWYGNRIYDLSKHLKAGENKIEIHLITTMGNYMLSLKDNQLAYKWVQRRQTYYPQGIIGPVTIYEK